jgi:phospholipase C
MKSAAKAVMSFALWVTVLAHAQPVPGQFKHVIIVIQENRTPDNLFAGVPRQNGWQGSPLFEAGVDLAKAPAPKPGAQTGQPWCLGACFDPGHKNSVWQNQYTTGLPGAAPPNPAACGGNSLVTQCNSQPVCNSNKGGSDNWPGCTLTNPIPLPDWPEESYVGYSLDMTGTQHLLDPYVSIATQYGFANYFYQTNQGPSQPAHDFLFGGTSAPSGDPTQAHYSYFAAENPHGTKGTTGCTAPQGQTVYTVDPTGAPSVALSPCFEHATLSDLLELNGLTWKYYTNDLGSIWTAPNGIGHICNPVSQGTCTNSDFTLNVKTPPNLFFHDSDVDGTNIHATPGNQSPPCTLPNLAWIIPDGTFSDHPGLGKGQTHSTDIEGGPNWVASIINAVGNATCVEPGGTSPWLDTVIFVVWDDWGGWYDHVIGVKGVDLFQDNDTFNGGICIPQYQPTGLFWGCGYTYGFRVPFLVVSAYTQPGTVSGFCTQGVDCVGQGNGTQNADPHRHDFGSILAFIEFNFGLQEGGINLGNNFPFADYFAPELQYDRKTGAKAVPLGDFFNVDSMHPLGFRPITTVNSPFTFDYFYNFNGPFTDPDNDVIDND